MIVNDVKVNSSVRIKFKKIDSEWHAIKVNDVTGIECKEHGIGCNQLEAFKNLQKKILESPQGIK